MKDPASIDAAVQAIPKKFMRCSIAQAFLAPPFRIGTRCSLILWGLRYLTEALLPRIAEGGAIASDCLYRRYGLERQSRECEDILQLDNSFESANAWFEKTLRPVLMRTDSLSNRSLCIR